MGRNEFVDIGRQLFNSVLRPSDFVAAQTNVYDASVWMTTTISIRLLVVYIANLLLYAVPLTIAGIGVNSDAQPPGWFGGIALPVSDPTTLWQFFQALFTNCLFLTAIAALTFVTYHGGVLLTRKSDGVTQTLHTVVYSTSAYLAVIFTLVVHLSTSPGIAVADDYVRALQAQFVYFFIDALGASLELPGGRPGTVSLTGLTFEGKLVLATLLLAVVYYLYSMYLGARLNHGTSRADALIVVIAIAVSPALYVIGSIFITTGL